MHVPKNSIQSVFRKIWSSLEWSFKQKYERSATTSCAKLSVASRLQSRVLIRYQAPACGALNLPVSTRSSEEGPFQMIMYVAEKS